MGNCGYFLCLSVSACLSLRLPLSLSLVTISHGKLWSFSRCVSVSVSVCLSASGSLWSQFLMENCSRFLRVSVTLSLSVCLSVCLCLCGHNFSWKIVVVFPVTSHLRLTLKEWQQSILRTKVSSCFPRRSSLNVRGTRNCHCSCHHRRRELCFFLLEAVCF